MSSREHVEINRAWGAIRVLLEQKFSFYDIKNVVSLAGMDPTELSHLEQKSGSGGASKGQLLTALDRAFSRFTADEKQRFLSYVAESLLKRDASVRDELEDYLARFGWGLMGTHVLPLAAVDLTVLSELPAGPRADLIKAVTRLRDGDLSGAISAAAGAVDTSTAAVYTRYGLGDSTKDTFQQRCKKAIDALDSARRIESELQQIGWNSADAGMLQRNFSGSLMQGAYVLQSLRSKMGDVHGTKPILKPLALDCVKWAEIWVRTLDADGYLSV